MLKVVKPGPGVTLAAGLAGLLTVAAVATTASAGVVQLAAPNASGFVAIGRGPYEFFSTLAVPSTFNQGGLGGATISVVGDTPNGPDVKAVADYAQGSVTLLYNYEVTGPANTLVELDFTGNLSTTGRNDFDAFGTSEAFVYGSAGTLGDVQASGRDWYAEACTGDYSTCAINPTSEAFNLVLLVPTNTVESLQLSAFAQGTIDDGLYTAEVDPLLSFDPSDDLQGLGLVVSPGIGNGPVGDPRPDGLPEPASWTLMIAGFGLVGASVRRSRRLDENTWRVQPAR